MVNEVAYNHVRRTSPDEQAQGRASLVTDKAGTQQKIWLLPDALSETE